MKADDRSFEINYKDLVRISDRGEDIYGSELGRDIVRAGCGDCAVALSVSMLKMQLEQEWFFSRKGDQAMACAVGGPEFSRLLHQTVCECVGRRLERYRGPAKRGALLNLIYSLEGLLPKGKNLWTERDRAVAARLPEDELISLAAYEAQRYAGGLWAAYGQEDKKAADEPQKPIVRSGCHATAAALALAAYAEYSDLRCAPELLADISAAAAHIAYAKPKEALTAAGYMALLTAAASLVDLAEAPLSEIEDEETGMGARISRERAEAFFRPFMGLFSIGLKLAMGAEAIGLLEEAAAAVRDFVPEAEQPPAADIRSWQAETGEGEAEPVSEAKIWEQEGEFC